MKRNRPIRLLSPFIFLIAFVTYSCKQTQEEIIPSAKYTPYISAYTGGVISRTSAIRIEMTKEQVVVDLNEEIRKSPFKFTPSIKGKTYWIDNKTLEFVPEEGALVPGKLYNAEFKLGDYMDVDKELRKFRFAFQVMEPNYTLRIDPLHVTSSGKDPLTVTGEIQLSDAYEKAVVEKILSASTTDKQNVRITIPGEETKSETFAFRVENVQRTHQDITLQVKTDGKAIGIDKTSTENITIPALDVFRFISAERILEPENGFSIVFSDPLKPNQNLRGLIEVEGVRTLTYQIDNNKVNIYFEPVRRSNYVLKIHKGIKNNEGTALEAESSISFSIEPIKPGVEFLTSGSILPDSKNLILPFRAVSLYAVDVRIVRIFEPNIPMFLQTNSISGADEIRRSGRLVYRRMLRLDKDPSKDLTQWENYSIDLSKLIEREPGALYRVRLSFKQEYSAYPCSENQATRKQFAEGEERLTQPGDGGMTEEQEAEWDRPYSYYSESNENMDWNLYNWNERENPCHPSYYMVSNRVVSKNVIASNLGVIVKRNTNNKLWLAVNNIIDTQPVVGADLTVLNFQLQPIGNARTDNDGFAVIEPKGVPFLVVAESNKQKTYVKVNDGEELSVTRFDVEGKTIEKGLKGFVYGERGVWRPGDTLHISFILEDRQKRIPDIHPVSLELFNPRGQFYTKAISNKGINGFYTFHIPTVPDDPTGLWNAYIKLGGATFHKALRIETIKPNRLKINLKLPELIRSGEGRVPVTLNSAWLTGATASGLKADVEMSLTKSNTEFKGYNGYVFTNPATTFETSRTSIFNGKLDGEGNARFDLKMPAAKDAPGMLRANLTTRVYEPGGDASIHTISAPFSPFTSYVGVRLNQPKGKYLETDKDHTFDVVTVDQDGKAVNRLKIEYSIYRISWSWWWEKRNESFESYINNTSVTPAKKGTIQTVNGKAQIKFRVDYPSWGRYLVYVKDTESGHAAGGTVYIDWPWERGASNKQDPSGVTMLSFSVDKEVYEPGETVTALIPAASDGRALIAIENGATVLHREWIQVSGKNCTKYQFKVTPDMAPNVYLHISLLQPHAQTVNELPIRMYGITPVFITDRKTVLEPQIKMPDVLRPEQEFPVTVNEKNGKPMTYTLAVVDDGLLDLTNFRTPDPWNEFYAREALGIKTWDMYDDVVGAFTGSYSLLFGTGGDEGGKQADAKANRFRPVVKYYGPFTLKRGGSQTHKITLPMYVGSVRTMIVAGGNGAYGNAQKTTPVRTPLMVLSSLPRVLSINEEIWLPVNVFAMEGVMKNVTVAIETTSNIQLVDGNKQTVTFNEAGDQLVYFRLKTGNTTGVGKVAITAHGNGHNTKEVVEIDVRNPNPVVTNNVNSLLEAGQTASLEYQLGSSSDENWVKLEASRIPSVDISRRMDFLYNYEHYCTEQLTSRALPLLFIGQFKETDNDENEKIKTNVKEAIRQLYGRQLPNGGFVYWPGYATADEWITSYAGNFLVLAKEKGYDVNPNVINKWVAFQRSAASNWRFPNRTDSWYYWQSDLQQAYRLYTLALAGQPELGAMNRMKESKDLSLQAKWRLAAAYAVNGKINAANELIFNAETTVKPYSSNNNVYGSYDRDEALILETLVLTGKYREAFRQAEKVSKNLTRQNHFSTQSTAFALMAMGKLSEKHTGSIDLEWEVNGQKQKAVKSARSVWEKDIPTNPLIGTVSVTNRNNGMLYLNLASRTRLLNDTLPAIAEGLKIEVRYVDPNGNILQVSDLRQGTDFEARVTVSNIGGRDDYSDLVLTHIVPSGWEIFNERMYDAGGQTGNSPYNYQDIRDDRVLTYFDLPVDTSKKFTVRLQATYPGTFTLPAIQCEGMYDLTIQARTQAGKVTVSR